MERFQLDANVECTDGPGGRLATVVVNPIGRKLTHIAVRGNQPGDEQFLVSLDHVVSTTEETITLNCTVAELRAMDPFTETHFIPAASPTLDMVPMMYYPYVEYGAAIPIEDQFIPAGELAIRRGARVEATDGDVGAVDEFIVDSASGSITHLVVKTQHLFRSKEIMLPVSAVDRVFDEDVYIKLSKAEVEALPVIPITRNYAAKIDPDAVELQLISFGATDTAGQALKTATDLAKREKFEVLTAATLVKDSNGKVKIDETQDVSGKKGAIFGVISGGLLGLLIGGPVGAAVGAVAGAATGGISANLIDFGFPKEQLEAFQKTMQPGSSALVMLAPKANSDALVTALAQYGGQVQRQLLDDDMLASLARSADDMKQQ